MANGGLLKPKQKQQTTDQERQKAAIPMPENETCKPGAWSVPKSGRCPKLNGKMSEFFWWLVGIGDWGLGMEDCGLGIAT